MTFNCTDAMAEVEKDFRAMEMTTRAGKDVRLKNLLLLSDDGLKAAMVILQSLDAAKESGSAELVGLLPKLKDLLLLVCDKPTDLKKEMADWPLGMAMNVVTAWQEATDLGEAQHSDD